MSRIIAPQWVNRRRRGEGRDRAEAERLTRGLPPEVPQQNLQLYLDARKTTYSATDPVDEWKDLSGRGNHLSQSTGSQQPTFQSAEINSLPAVVFDSANSECLTSTDFGSVFTGYGVPVTWAMVLQLPSTGQNGFITGAGNGSSSDPQYYFGEGGGNWQTTARFTGGGNITNNGPAADTSPHVIIVQSNGWGSFFQVDGPSTRGSGAGSAGDGEGPFNQYALGCQFRTNQNNFMSMSVGMLMCWVPAIHFNEIDAVEQFMGDAYGITIS